MRLSRQKRFGDPTNGGLLLMSTADGLITGLILASGGLPAKRCWEMRVGHVRGIWTRAQAEGTAVHE